MSHHEPIQGEELRDVPGPGQITIKPLGFHIVWGKDSRYWQLPEKDSNNPAELKQVCWLEITGSVDVTAQKTYEIEFIVSMKPDAFGWKGCPVFMMAKVGKRGKYTWKKINTLDGNTTPGQEFSIPAKDKGQELKIKVNSTSENKLFFGLYEVWSGKWKGGLLIHKAIIKEVN